MYMELTLHPSTNRIVFSFDPADIKSMSNETLDKSMGEEELRTVSHQRPIISEIIFKRRSGEMDKRYSAPLKGNMRDSVGSIDYLSEGPVDSDDEESVQSEVRGVRCEVEMGVDEGQCGGDKDNRSRWWWWCGIDGLGWAGFHTGFFSGEGRDVS